MNKEKLYSICRRFFAFVCAAFVVVFSVGLPSAKADFEPVTDYFYSSSTWTNNDWPSISVPCECGIGVYVFRGNSDDGIFAISESQNATVYVPYWLGWDGAQHQGFDIVCDTQIGDYWYGFGASGIGADVVYGEAVTNYCPRIISGHVLTLEVAEDFAAFLGDQLPSYEGQFQVPAGYVAYIQSPSGTTLSLSQDFGYNSRAWSDVWGDGSSGQSYLNSVVALPSSNTVFPLSGMSNIPFVRSSNRNILGQSRVGLCDISSSGGYTVIYNPFYRSDYANYPVTSTDELVFNKTIYVSASSVSLFRLYPLSESFVGVGGDIQSGSLSGYDDYSDATVDEDTGNVVYTDQDGVISVVAPATGGTNQIPETVSNTSFLEQIRVILSGIAESIGSIFSFAYEAIVSLVSLATPFIQKLGVLYSWLPPSVFSALTSAMILAITIGVLKAFL